MNSCAPPAAATLSKPQAARISVRLSLWDLSAIKAGEPLAIQQSRIMRASCIFSSNPTWRDDQSTCGLSGVSLFGVFVLMSGLCLA